MSNTPCSIDHVIQNNIDKAMSTFIGKGKHFKRSGKDTLIGVPSTKLDMYTLGEVVKTNTIRTQKWIDKKFNNNTKLTSNWIDIVKFENEIKIQFKIPDNLKVIWQRKLDRLNNEVLKEEIQPITTEGISSETEQFMSEVELNTNLSDINDFVVPEETFIFTNIEDVSKPSNKIDEEQLKDALFENKTGKSTISSTEILLNIQNKRKLFNLEGSKYNFLFNQLAGVVNKTGSKTQFVSEDTFKRLNPNVTDNTVMFYNVENNTIYVSRERFKMVSPELLIESFLHEVVHSIVAKTFGNPTTAEEHQLKEFIEKAYKQYSAIDDYLGPSSTGRQYGFTNPFEFIAEVFSNQEFRKHLEKTEVGFLTRLVRYISELIGKIPGVKEFIRSAILFETVDSYINKTDASDFKGGNYNIYGSKSFSKETTDIKSEFASLENKLDYAFERVIESLDRNIETYSYLSKIMKDTAGVSKHLSNLEDLKSNIESYQFINKINGIIAFLDEMGKTLDFVESKLNSIDYNNSEEVKNIARIYNNYLITYNVIEDIEKLIASIREDSNQLIIDKKDLKDLEDSFDYKSGKFRRLNTRFIEVKKHLVSNLLNDIKYFPKVEKAHYDRLAIEHRNNQITQDKETWIIDKMINRDSHLIQSDLEKAVQDFINNPSFDIFESDVLFSSSVNVSSPLISIMNQLLTEVDNRRLNIERKKDIEFKKLFDKLVKEKGTVDVNTLYKNIIKITSTGKQFLATEIDLEFHETVYLEIRKLKKELYSKTTSNKQQMMKLSSQGLINSQEYSDLLNENKALEKEYSNKINKLEEDNLIFDKDGKIIDVQDKWKKSLSHLSATELEVLNFFKKITQDTYNATHGKQSLIDFAYRINDSENKFERYVCAFYELPKITKTETERLWSGDVKGSLKDNWKDLTSIRPDDIGYTTVEKDMSGNVINRLKIHYRGKLDPKDQSLDLMNAYRLEFKNGVAYDLRKESELDLNFLLDVAKNKKYYENTGSGNILNRRTKKLDIIDAEKSSTLKMLNNMMEIRFYDMFNKAKAKTGTVDRDKLISKILGASSFLTMTANLTSATANVLNGKAQLFLESFIKGHHITASNIAKAEIIYGKNLQHILRDEVEGLKLSFVNQVLEMFNIRGSFGFSESNFLKASLMKRGLHLDTLKTPQEASEHWVQSIVALSVLDNVKVMNKDHQFINKDGKLVDSEDEAASVLDMLETNDQGLVEMNSNVVYTTHSRLSEFNLGGKEKLDALVVKKINDSLGNYRKIDQPEIQRLWYGKLLMQYRKYLVPMGQARLRGIETAFKKKSELIEQDRRFSYALQEYEEGTYVTTIRYLYTCLADAKKGLHMIDNWNELSDYEKHNIKRAITEVIVTSVLLPLLVALLGAGADDDRWKYFAAYQLRRLETELSSYYSISENFKMLRSPIPSSRLLELGIHTLTTVLNPFDWDELIDEDKDGNNKLLKRWYKQIPILKEFMKDYENLFKFQNARWGTFGGF